MRSASLLLLGGMALGIAPAGCATWIPELTYDRFDPPSGIYVNDTAGFVLVFPRGWRVSTQVDSSPRLLSVLPLPSATEVSMKARTADVGLWVETTKVDPRMSLESLQPAILRAYGEALRQFRYHPHSLEKRSANGLDYMEWVYQLRSPDFDQTFLEGMFVRGGYAVRIRAKTETESFDQVRGRIHQLLGTLTALDAVQRAKDRVAGSWSN
jgi:hypothetical protein